AAASLPRARCDTDRGFAAMAGHDVRAGPASVSAGWLECSPSEKILEPVLHTFFQLVLGPLLHRVADCRAQIGAEARRVERAGDLHRHRDPAQFGKFLAALAARGSNHRSLDEVIDRIGS